MLGTSAYEASTRGRRTSPSRSRRGRASRRSCGRAAQDVRYADYGFPDAYSVIVIGNPAWLQAHPDAAAAFVAGLAARLPARRGRSRAAVKLLIDANPGVFTEPELVYPQPADVGAASTTRTRRGRSARRPPPSGRAIRASCIDAGVLSGPDGKRVTRSTGLRDVVHRTGDLTVLELRTRRVETRDSPGRRAAVGRAAARGRCWCCVGLVVWQVAVDVSGVARRTCCPRPLRVLEQGWENRAQLWANTLPTLRGDAVGFAVSLAVGWALAVLVDFSPWLRRALTPLLVASQTLPIVAIAPLMIIWFGFGLLPKVVRGRAGHVLPDHRRRSSRGSRPPTAQATSTVALSMGACRAGRSSARCGFPARCRSSSPALRIGITYAVTGAIFAEYVGATAGPRDLHAERRRTRSAPTSCWPRSSSRRRCRWRSSRSRTWSSAAIPWYALEPGDQAMKLEPWTRLTQELSARSRCSTTSRSTSRRGSSCRCSGRAAAASRRRST